MCNQRPSHDEERNFVSCNRNEERGGYCNVDLQNRGRGEEGRDFQGGDENRIGGYVGFRGEGEQQWRGGQSGQQGQGGYGGQEQQDRMFDQADRRSSEHDEDFHNFRNEHMNKLEGNYQEWRNERRKKFAEEFEKWRSERNAKQASQGGTEGIQGQKKNP